MKILLFISFGTFYFVVCITIAGQKTVTFHNYLLKIKTARQLSKRFFVLSEYVVYSLPNYKDYSQNNYFV